MRGNKTRILWPIALTACMLLLIAVQRMRWPTAKDSFTQLRKSVAAIEPFLPADSALSLRVSGLSEVHFNYLRYCLIPRPLELKFSKARRAVLLTSRETERAAFDRFYLERPDLECVSRIYGPDHCLALFKPRS